MIVNFQLWSEFAKTNERCFEPLLWPVEAGRNVAHSFRQTHSQVSLKFTIILILGALNNMFHNCDGHCCIILMYLLSSGQFDLIHSGLFTKF